MNGHQIDDREDLLAVEAAALKVDGARERLSDAERELRDAVVAALAEGTRATDVADVLGVSRARVYQIRDGRR